VKELSWVTTSLTSEPTKNSAPKYTDGEACASLFLAIDILTHNDGIRYSGFEGQAVETARGLLVLVVCALRYLLKMEATYPNLDPATLEDLTDKFFFNEI
jgi:hypothetical protein